MTGTTAARAATPASGRRGNRSFRAWDGSYEDLKRTAGDAGTPPTTLVGDAVEALLLRYIRCTRCSMPVSVEVRDCTGIDLAEAVATAVLEVHAQRCWAREGVGRVKRPVHHPVTIGNAAPQAPAPGAAPGSAVFLEPGGKPRAAAAVPEVPASRNKKGRRP